MESSVISAPGENSEDEFIETLQQIKNEYSDVSSAGFFTPDVSSRSSACAIY